MKSMVYRSLRHERGNPDTDDSWNLRVSMPNNPCEAYTANQIGHRGRPHSPEVWHSFDTKFHADDDVVNDTEVNTKDSIWRESGGSAGVHRAWYV